MYETYSFLQKLDERSLEKFNSLQNIRSFGYNIGC